MTRSLARPYVERILGLTRRRIEIFDGAGEDWRFAESLKSISEDTAQEYEGRAVLELVQNGHDALGHDERGRIAVVLDLTEEPGALYVANEGRPFTDENFRAITEFALSDKGAGEGIGNKGLGFRSVLQLTDWPEIYSRSGPGSPAFDGYCFRFAAEHDLESLIDDPALLRRVVEQVSPLALPVPALPQGEVLDNLLEQGYSTVVRLPLRSDHAAEAAREQIAALAADDVPLLLFLDRVRALTAEVLHRGRDADSAPEVDLGRAVEPTTLTGLDTSWAQEIDLGRSGRYLLARRPLDAGPLSEAIARSVAARELDQRWAEWDGSGAWVGLALRLDRPLDAGRLYTFLPMAATAPAPLCAHAHAPFFTKLARLTMSDSVPLNAHLLDELAVLSAQMLRAVRDYAPSAMAAALVPDLACWDPPARLDAVLHGALEDEPLVPLAGGRGWAPLSTAYDWPDDARPWAELTRQALAQRGKDLLDAAAVGQPRRARIAKLHQALLGALMRPSSELAAEWAEDIAGSLPPPEASAAPARWAAFYDDVQQAFRSDPSPLRGRRIVLDQAGALRRALGGDGPGRDDTLFFSPEQSSADSPARIPSDLRALRARMAFTHPDIPWSKGARAFFETGQLVREYRADRVYDALRDLLATSRSDALRRDALAFAFRQFPSLNAAQHSALRGVGFYVPRGDGSWALASHSLMSPGWGTEGAFRLERFLAAAGDKVGELSVLRTLRIAGPDGWPGGVADTEAYAQFLSSIGVRDGLPLSEVGPVSERQGGQLAPFIIARQYGLPDAVAAGWAEDVAAVWNGGAHPQTRYQFSHAVRALPGAGDLPALGPGARRELAELIALGLAHWDDEAFAVTVWRPTRPYGQQDPHRWPTPLASAMRHLPWLPVTSNDDDGDGGGMRFVAPSAAWYSLDGDLPPFVPSMPLALRRLLSGPRALDRAVAAGLRRWDDPAHAPDAVRELGSRLADGAVPDHLLATFRKHYARALAAAAARPGGSWARDGAVLAAVRNGRLEAVVAAEDDPLYIPDEHGALKQSLVELAGHPVLVADADDGEAVAAALTAQGVSAVRLSDVTVKVFSADDEIVPGPQRPLLAAGRDWFVTVVALALELKSGTFVRRTERTLRALLSTVRSVRVARVPEVAVIIGGAPAVPADGVRSIPLPDPADPTVAVWDTHGEWDELQACVPALAQLLAQPYLHDALELALIKLERLLGEEPPNLVGDEALARALDTTVARVSELRRGLEGDVDGVKRLLRPVLAVITHPADRDAADDALTSSGTEEALIGLLVPHEAALGRTAADVIALLRHAGAIEEARDLLGLDFAAFNEALQWLGRPYGPLTHPDLHDAAMTEFLAQRGEAVIERLRERYRPLAAAGHDDASGYAAGRRFDGLVPDPDWLTACRVPAPELLRDCVCAWLAGHGAKADLDAPAVLLPVDAMRSAAAARLEELVGAAEPLVRAWCRKHGADAPAAWAATPLLEASFALAESGMADLIELDDAGLLAAAAAGAGWPEGMPLSAEAGELGLAPEDLRRAEDDAATARKASRPATTIFVGEQELPVGTDNLARIAEAALASVDPAFLAQSGRTVLAQMAAGGSRQGAGGGGRGAVARDRALSEDERAAIGIVGEVAARAWLAHKYRDVKWISGYAAIVSGARDASDGHGYDFQVAWRNTTLMFEVKAMRAEPGRLVEFEMGESEVRAAQAAARGDRYRILLVTSVLDPSERRIHRLPNPFSAKGQGLFRVAGRGLRYQFSPS